MTGSHHTLRPFLAHLRKPPTPAHRPSSSSRLPYTHPQPADQQRERERLSLAVGAGRPLGQVESSFRGRDFVVNWLSKINACMNSGRFGNIETMTTRDISSGLVW